MRFGLDDGTPKTLEEVAEHFGITRERIRQIQEQSLEKMRDRIAKRDPQAKLPHVQQSGRSPVRNMNALKHSTWP